LEKSIGLLVLLGRTPMKPCHSCLAIFLFAFSVPAEAELKGCYERVYDAAHMAKHKDQIVHAIQLQVGFEHPDMDGEDEDDLDSLAVKFRSNSKLYYAGPHCAKNVCVTDRQGERFILAETEKGLTLRLESKLKVNEEAGGDETEIDILPDAENKTFALPKVSEKNCTYFYYK
jgi:hypothetical protein